MKPRKGLTVELAIDKMAYGGQGIGRMDGFVIFVRGTVPGDRISARIYRKKKGYAKASLVELLSPSPDRIVAPCPYRGHCGGCQWQHINYERQLQYKKEQIRECLEHIAGLKDVPLRNVTPSDKSFGYRNKMEFSFSDRQWFLPHELEQRETEGGVALGLHVPGAYYKVIDIEACMLQQEGGNRILKEVKEYVKKSGIPVYGLKSHKGFWRYLTLRHSSALDEWMVNVVTSEERQEPVRALADTLSSRVERIRTCVNNINGSRASTAIGEREIVLLGEGYIEDRIGPFTFHISANSFFQTNSLAAYRLYQKVADYAELKGNENILDLYSGTGTIPVLLANSVRSVTGMEISSSAVMDAQRNCKVNDINNCHFVAGDIKEKMSTVTNKPDILIIDPPRAGMHKDVLAQVLALSPKKIIYISCNPATLARDIVQMVRDYELREIQPFDMFPHTYHIEAVANLQIRKRT